MKVILEVRNESKSQFIAEIKEAFNNVKLYEQGKKKLKTAKQLLNEL